MVPLEVWAGGRASQQWPWTRADWGVAQAAERGVSEGDAGVLAMMALLVLPGVLREVGRAVALMSIGVVGW